MSTLEQVQERIAEAVEMLNEETGVQLVAAFEGAVIGTVAIRRRSHPLLAHRAELEDVVVHGDYWRRGFARQLVDECFLYARSLGIEIVEVSVRGGTSAEDVYRRLGFIEYGRLPRGIIEPWGERLAYDEVFFYQPVE
jgi:ribosomal protein S18 acetylase RimI-like enzyme